MHDVAVLIPIYREFLDRLETISLDVSIPMLHRRKIYFITASNMNIDFYKQRYPDIEFKFFHDKYFQSIGNYNELLLSPFFYENFSDFEFVLILQTDGICFRDELDFWLEQPYDYIGAPWPDAYTLQLNIDQFTDVGGVLVQTKVGNGGVSLRRINKMIDLLNEFPQSLNYFLASQSSEDLYFSVLGAVSKNFIIPNFMQAALFSLELNPGYFVSFNRGKLPCFSHAWWKHDLNFWKSNFPDLLKLA